MRRLCLLLCFSLMFMLLPVQAWAGFSLDVNGDGQIHLDDIVRTLVNQGAVDVNGDGHVDAADLQTLLAQTGKAVSSPSSLTGSASGRVVDNYDSPVQGAAVSLDGSLLGTYTDGQGGFRIDGIPLSVGNRLTVTKDGYVNAVSSTFSVLATGSAVLLPILLNHRTGSVTGVVYNANHEGVGDASVFVSGGPIASVHTAANGSFTYSGVPVGLQSVTVVSSVYGMLQQTVQIAEQATAVLPPFVFAPLPPTVGVVTGAVYDQQGAPLGGVSITAAPATVASSTYRTATLADGSFSLPALPPGGYTIDATTAGYAPQSQTVMVAAGANPALRFDLQHLTFVSGTVIRDDGTAVAGASVTLTAGVTYSATTDANGRFSFAGFVTNATWATLTVQASGLVDYTQTFSLQSGNSYAFDGIRLLQPVGGFSFAAMDTAGHTIPNVSYSLSLNGTTVQSGTAWNGTQTFAGLAVGTYALQLSATDYVTTTATIIVAQGSNASQNVTLPHATDTVSGSVVGTDGVALAGAAVHLQKDGVELVSQTTRTDGSFRFDGIDTGTAGYRLQVEAAGYVSQQVNIVMPQSGVTIMLSLAGATVTGMVYGTSGKGIANAVVSLTGDATATTTTDSSGQYRFSGLQPGYYSINVQGPGTTYAPGKAQAFDVIAGQVSETIGPIVQRLLSETGTVTGTVYDIAGLSGIGGATVVLIPSNAQDQLQTITESQGQYRFDYVPANDPFELVAIKDGFAQGYLFEQSVSGAGFLDEPVVTLRHVADAGTVAELTDAILDPNVGEIRLTADISTLTDEDSSNDALDFGNFETADYSIMLTSDKPVTLDAASFSGPFSVTGSVYLRSHIGSDLDLLQSALQMSMSSAIVVDSVAGYSGNLERQLAADDTAYYYVYQEADGSRTAFVNTGQALQAALLDSVVNSVYVTDSIFTDQELTFPARALSLHALPDRWVSVTGNTIKGYDAERVLLDNVEVTDSQPPIVSSIESSGSTATIHFDEFGSLEVVLEALNPWIDSVIFKDHNGTVVPYADANFWSMSESGKDLTLTFAQSFAAGDRLEFTQYIHDQDYNSMVPIAWIYDGTGWKVSPDVDGNTTIAIDPMEAASSDSSMVYVEGTASDADGDVYLNDVRLSIYSNKLGKFARYDSESESLVFDADTPQYDDAYGSIYGDSDGLFHWYGYVWYHLASGLYTITAEVYKHDQVQASAQATLTVKPAIAFDGDPTIPIDLAAGPTVATDANGTFYLVNTAIGLGDPVTKESLESAFASAANSGKVSKMTAVQGSGTALNTTGLLTGTYNLYFVADSIVSDPLSFTLVASPTASYYVDNIYGYNDYGLTVPLSSNTGYIKVLSDVSGKFYVIPADVAIGSAASFIADHQSDSSQVFVSNEIPGNNWYNLSPTSLSGGKYKLYAIDDAGHLSETLSAMGFLSIGIYDRAQLPLYLIQYFASIGNTSSVTVQMLTDAGIIGADTDHLSLYQAQLSSEDMTIESYTAYDDLKAHIQSVIDTQNQTYLVTMAGSESLTQSETPGSLDFQLTPALTGTVYYAAVVHSAAAPTQAQVLAGLDGSGAAAAAFGSFAAMANTQTTNTITLLAGQAYDLYYVIESNGHESSYSAVENVNGVIPYMTLTVAADSAIVGAGLTLQMQLLTNPGETAPLPIVWSVNDTMIATIDPVTGLLTGLTDGSVVVTATDTVTGQFASTAISVATTA